MKRRAKRALGVLLAAFVAPVVALGGLAAVTPLPPELERPRAASTGVLIHDRSGVLLRELRADDGTRARWISLDTLGDRPVRALLAAEDRRFFLHPGVDPVATVRAAGQMLAHRRIVSGASTITQQLARTVVPRPRTFTGKVREMALALRIEASLSKREILEQYVNRVAFGPGIRGIDAASRFYLDKAASDLSLAEAAALASLPRGPALYNPSKGSQRLLRRRDRVLTRLEDAGLAPPAEVARAHTEPLALGKVGSSLGAPHLVRAVMASGVDAAAGALRNRASVVTLTIDRHLQREVEVLAQREVRALAARGVSAAAVVVLDNATSEVLAYVGSPDIGDERRLGHNDGVLALRQPGSALKPFVYGLAMERLGFTAATVLPDVELHLPTRDGDYRPNNYDGKFHGPVRLREALGNSYNVPAVWTAAALGPDRVLDRLHELGFRGLTESADHYGVAIALGDVETRLLDLANAYATLARGGVLLPVVAVKHAIGKDDRPLVFDRAPPKRVLDAGAAFIITDILADRFARLASFGEGNVLELPFPVAAKTGTSKGFRDNVTVGFTRDVTVAVWVGNFDGSSMEGVSGVMGAGPLFQATMLAAARGRPNEPFVHPDDIEVAEVCALSGERKAGPCAHGRREVFAGHPPSASCSMHELVSIDKRNGLLAGPGCPDALVEQRVFERFEAQLMNWARGAGRTIAPERWSPLCPGGADERGPQAGRKGPLRVAFPTDGATFAMNPALQSRQEVTIRADVPPGMNPVHFVIDGKPHSLSKGPYALRWPLTPGQHRVHVEAGGATSEPVEFAVE